jgi:hypothetical protein
MECDKITYSSQTEAKLALDGINNDNKRYRGKNLVHRVYECKECKHWHLSSRKKRGKTYRDSPKFLDRKYEAAKQNIDELSAQARKKSRIERLVITNYSSN